MAMDYFRRPTLVGKNLPRTPNGKVRGSIRRSDPDGSSAVPYFPGVSATQTLLITTQAGNHTATLSGNGLNAILADINTAIGVNAKAYSDDGCIAIESTTLGSNGFVRITGGTASASLGFQTFSGTRNIEGRGSDIASTTEGRINNPFGASFPALGEDGTRESITRGLGRIASNTDVLWSDVIKDALSYKTVSFSASTDGKYITPTAAQRLFIGSGSGGLGLSASSTAKDLIPFYQLVDTVTGLPAASQVVAVVRGTPVGNPPYANSPSWSDVTGKNILGQDQAKVTTSTINAIAEGRYVTCNAATFITTGVVAGDLAEIASATNTDQWSNNGYRWIVESVLSETVLSLRPMSKGMLDTVGTVPVDTQPILELNDQLTGIQVFGTLTVRTGPVAHNVTLVTRPPLPTGAAYELRAAVPGSLHSDKSHDKALLASAAMLDMTAPETPIYNGVTSGLTASLSGGNCVITAGRVRWRGRAYSIPAQTLLPGAFVNGVNYVYLNDADLVVTVAQVTTGIRNTFDPTASTNKGHLLAYVNVAVGAITSVLAVRSFVGDNDRLFTVGTGGHFPSLEAFARYITEFSNEWSETVTASGSFPHFEALLINDLSFTGASFTAPGLTIRGIHPKVKLTMTGGLTINCRQLTVKDLFLDATVSAFVAAGANTCDRITISNVRHTNGTITRLVDWNGFTLLSDVRVTDSEFRISTNVVRGTGTGGRGVDNVKLQGCTFNYVAGAAPHIIQHSTSAATAWDGNSAVIQDCDFLGAWGGASASGDANPLFIKENNGNATGGNIVIENVRLSLGNYVSADNASLVSAFRNCVVRNLRVIAGKIPVAVNDTGGGCKIYDSTFTVNPSGTTQVAVKASMIQNCFIVHVDTDNGAQTNGGIGAQGNVIIGCSISGAFYRGINSTGQSRISSNNVSTFPESNATVIDSGIFCDTTNQVSVVNNKIQTLNSGVASFGVRFIGTTTDATVANNWITTDGDNAIAISFTGTSHLRASIANNNIVQSNSGSGTIGISGKLANASVVGNNIFNTNLGIRHGSGSADVVFANNSVTATTAYGSEVVVNNEVRLESNTLIGDVTNFIGEMIGNHIIGNVTHYGPSYIEGNKIEGNVTGQTDATAISSLHFVGNHLTGNLDEYTNSPRSDFVFINANYIAGTCKVLTANGGGGTNTVIVTNNNIRGTNFTIDSNVTNRYVTVLGNFFSNASFTFLVQATGYAWIEDNFFDHSNAPSITATATEIQFNRNQVQTDFTSVSVNSATAVVLTVTSRVTVTENVINGRIAINSATTVPSIIFVGNYVQYTGGNHAVSLGTPTQELLFANNRIRNDQASRTDESNVCLVIGTAAGPAKNLTISGNFFRLIGSGYSGTPPTFAFGVINSNIVWDTVAFTGNIIEKPLDLAAPARQYFYINNTNAGTVRISLAGNLCKNPTNVGAAPRDGSVQAATNVTGVFSLAQ